MWKSFADVASDVGISVAVHEGLESLRGGVKEGAHEASRRIVSHAASTLANKWAMEERRIETFALIDGVLRDEETGAVDVTAADNLLEWHRLRQECANRPVGENEPEGSRGQYLPGDEDRMAMVLTKIYVALSDPSEWAARKDLFKALGHLTQEQFDARIEAWRNDSIGQIVKRIGVELRDAGISVDRFVHEQIAVRLRSFLQDPSRSSWLLEPPTHRPPTLWRKIRANLGFPDGRDI